ncbi:MAG TPA: efflux RND transporter periplasmic adaptor subunit [Acidisarcina sp.]|nr:efflux RND transporter periplasmic adaptor subunit [Acidisarcina sp.]
MSRTTVRSILFSGTRARLLAAPLLFVLAGCHQKATPVADSPNSASSVVETAVVHSQQIVNKLDIPARVSPDPTRVVHVFSQISGRLAELYVRPGQDVARGQKIGLIQSSDVASARSDYEKAKIEALRADRQLDRAKLLLQHEVIAQKDFDDLQAASEAAHAEMSRTEQRIHMLGFSVGGSSDTAILKAPISGAVLDIGSATGEMQKSLDNAASIATIANLDEVWVLGDVYERDLASVKPGTAVDVTFSAYPQEVVHGKIANVSDAIDPTSLTLKVRVVLNNPNHRYKPLMYATITIDRSTSTAYVIPATAVIHEGAASYVFVQQSPGKYEKRIVSTAQSHGDTIAVTSGLHDGDSVVTTGAALLRAPAGD